MFLALSPETQEQSLVDEVNSILEPSAENEYNVMKDWFSSWDKGDILVLAESFQET